MATAKRKKAGKVVAIENTEKGLAVTREAPPERMQQVKNFLSSVLDQAQIALILNKTPDYAVKKRPGPQGKSLTYVKHGYVTDQLNKLFGFNWDLISEPVSGGSMFALQVETFPNPDPKAAKIKPIIEVRHIVVAGRIEARVFSKDHGQITIVKSGFGSQIWHPSMELGDAVKAAQSDLLKSCAAKLGVALDLYWDDLAEQSLFEQAQVEKQKKEQAREEEEVIEGLTTEVPYKNNGSIPVNGVMLIAQAQSQFKFDINKIKRILGDNFINEYTPEMWLKIVKEAENEGTT